MSSDLHILCPLHNHATFGDASIQSSTHTFQVSGEACWLGVSRNLESPRFRCRGMAEEGALELAGVPPRTCLEAVGGPEDLHEALDGAADVATLGVLFRTLNKVLQMHEEDKHNLDP